MWLSVIKMWPSCYLQSYLQGKDSASWAWREAPLKSCEESDRLLGPRGHNFSWDQSPNSSLLFQPRPIPRRTARMTRPKKKKKTPSHATPLSPVWQSFHCSVKKPSRTRSCSKRSTAWMQSLQRSRQLGKLANDFLVFNWIRVFFVLWTRVELSRISSHQTSAVPATDKPRSHFVPQLFYLFVTDQGFSER